MAEGFRALGWLHPIAETSLNFTFTLLGQQIMAAEDNYLPLFRESVLGMVYPSRVLQVLGDFDLRPFAFLLKVMLATDGYITRDEMIIAPFNMSDRLPDAVKKASKLIEKSRKSKAASDFLLANRSGKHIGQLGIKAFAGQRRERGIEFDAYSLAPIDRAGLEGGADAHKGVKHYSVTFCEETN